MKLSADIIIIGSGASGGVLAATLAERTGKKIILLEKGGYYEGASIVQEELGVRHLFSERGTRGTKDGSIPIRGGQCIGGGTTVNVALCFDPLESVWKKWKSEFGIEEYSFNSNDNDYDINGLNMANALKDVRKRINVHEVPDNMVNDNNRLFKEGCQSEGVSFKKFELNIKNCIECGFCAVGCKYDRKMGTMITYVADAIQNGVEVIHNFDVEKIIFSGSKNNKKATGIQGKIREANKHSLPNKYSSGTVSISAGLIILAAGAIESPALLFRSKHPNPGDKIGRGLIIHPSLPIIGLQDNQLVNYRGITGSMYSDHFYESHGFYYECLFGHPIYASGMVPGFGTEHFNMILNYPKINGFGVMLVDTPVKRNRVIWNSFLKKPEIIYRLTKTDKKRMRIAAKKGVEIMFGSGAKKVMLPSEEPIGPLDRPTFNEKSQAEYCDQLNFNPHQTQITSAHPQATVSMGEEYELGILNSRCESKYIKNLIVCDSSSFPSSCGANPMVSIMTMARYQGIRISGELNRYDL